MTWNKKNLKLTALKIIQDEADVNMLRPEKGCFIYFMASSIFMTIVQEWSAAISTMF